MTSSEKLLLFALESACPDQVEALAIKGVPLSELVTQSLAEKLYRILKDSAGLAEADRLDAIQQFKQMGIDLEEV
jgi:hypothetical protein